MTSPLPGLERGSCWVLDSSAAINFKTVIPEEHQSRFWDWLFEFVERDELTFPREVWEEVGVVEYPDELARWMKKAKDLIGALPDTDDAIMAELGDRHPDLIKGHPERNAADPYVVALAIERHREGFAARVIADDKEIQSACTKFKIASETAKVFVQRFPRA